MKGHGPGAHLRSVLETAVMQVSISTVPSTELLLEVSKLMEVKRGFYLYVGSFILRNLYFEDPGAEGIGWVS